MMIDAHGENNTIYGNQYYELILVLVLLLHVIFKLYFRTNEEIQEQPQFASQTKIYQSADSKIAFQDAGAALTKQHLNPTFKPVEGILKHTVAIGTPDNPTIDGGFINSADGFPVIIPEPIKDPHNSSQENDGEKRGVQNDPTKIGSVFHDEWATSERVKEFLKSAAKDGKLAYVLDKTEKKGLPASIAIVPMVESNYQPNVTSNKGAGGVWQLMPQTAKDYGLKNEDRYRFEPATDVALNLLQDLHKQFGSWELAYAAYNAGADRVNNALHKNPQAASVQELDLPKETKDYVMHIIKLNKTMETL